MIIVSIRIISILHRYDYENARVSFFPLPLSFSTYIYFIDRGINLLNVGK